MADIPTFDDFFQVGKFEILRRPTRFNSKIVDTDGSDVNIVVACGAAMSDDAARFSQDAFNETRLSTAIRSGGEILDRWVWDHYQMIRQGAQQAVAPLSFSRTNTAGTVSIPAGTVVTSDDGQTFETVNGVIMGVGVAGPVIVTAFAQIAGEAGNVEAGSLRTIVSSLTDPEMTVTNGEAAAGGLAEETDTALGQRARDFFVNARRGTRRAIQNGCVTTPGVAQASVTEDLSVDGVSNYRIQAIISDANGQANTSLAANVLTRLEEYRALGVPCRVVAGVKQDVSIVVEGLIFEAGAQTTILIDQIRAQIVSQVNQLNPGATLDRSLIFAAIRMGVSLVRVPETAVVSPAGDLVPSSSSGVIRTAPSLVSVNGLTGGT